MSDLESEIGQLTVQRRRKARVNEVVIGPDDVPTTNPTPTTPPKEKVKGKKKKGKEKH